MVDTVVGVGVECGQVSSKETNMEKCDGCGKKRARRDLLTCSCCDGRFCIIGEVSETCANIHES